MFSREGVSMDSCGSDCSCQQLLLLLSLHIQSCLSLPGNSNVHPLNNSIKAEWLLWMTWIGKDSFHPDLMIVDASNAKPKSDLKLFLRNSVMTKQHDQRFFGMCADTAVKQTSVEVMMVLKM